MFKFPHFITKNTVLLALTSLFTDIASEMLYPVMPLYIRSLGYSAASIGLLEGFIESLSSLIKLFFGYFSDKLGKRRLFVRMGYALSAISKPIMGLYPHIGTLFVGRVIDRIGKGIRTAPRDAILSSEAEAQYRGRVFGFHRSADTLGAMLGPVIALVYLYFYPQQYVTVFFLAIIPGLLSVLFTFQLSQDKNLQPDAKPKFSVKDLFSAWKTSSVQYKKLVMGFFAFSLVNSSNMFLILRAQEVGISDVLILASYITYNLVFMVVSYPMGVIADKVGFKHAYVVGLLFFALAYGLFGFPQFNVYILFIAFALYGVFATAEESINKAWLTLHLAPENRATGLGFHMMLSSLAVFFASAVTGLLWVWYGSSVTLTLIAALGLIVCMYFIMSDIDKPTLEQI